MPKSKSLSIRLDEELFKKLEDYSYKSSQSRTQVIEDAICFHLFKQDDMSVDNKTEELRELDRVIIIHLLKSQATIEKCLDSLLTRKTLEEF